MSAEPSATPVAPGVVLVAVRSEELVATEALAAVQTPSAGAVVLFTGTVRHENAGLSVTLLEYEAYASMAEKEMRAIASEIACELPGVRLAALHRTGALTVGAVAVLCAASAPHRHAAFDACQKLIDRIKERVPIWKREHGPDGPYWVGWEDARCSAHEHPTER